MANGIGRVWAANAGDDEQRPNGVGSVWIENIDALAPSGGASEQQINELSAAIEYVSAIAGGGTDGVSGTNAVFVPYYEGANYGKFYSATISGDVVVTTGMYFDNGASINPNINYSLSSIGSKIDNKLDKNKIEDSNTIAIINNHAEVTDKAYRTTGFDTTSASRVLVNINYVQLNFNAYNVNPDSHLYSATVTVETTASGTYIPNGWSLVNYENNSAIFTRYYPLDETSDNFYLPNAGGWGDFTNAEGSATVYSALEVGHLAFKDEIPSTANFYPNTNPSSFVNEDWVTAQGYLTAHQDISNKLDTTAFSTVSGDFLTAVDLTPYQTIEGMTAYQPVGDYVQGSDLELNAYNKISAISGHELAGGGGTTYTGDAQGALDEVYANSGKWISTTNNDASALFYSNLVTDGNQTFYGPILSAKATNNYYTNLFEIRAGRFTIASENNYNYVSAYFSPECISSYGNGNWTGGNWDWHLDYRGLGGTFSDNYSNKATWSALRNVDLGLTTGGVVSSISGHGLTIGDVNNIVLTASLPVSPDANTLYLIPEA